MTLETCAIERLTKIANQQAHQGGLAYPQAQVREMRRYKLGRCGRSL